MAAIFSECKRYRYRLERNIDMFGGPIIGFCLHNPSVAGAISNDPTSRRGIGFTAYWGGSKLIFVNSWAGIATRPSDLWIMADPVGPENDRYIFNAATEIAASGGFMVAAWGRVMPPSHLRLRISDRIKRVQEIIYSARCTLKCVGTNSDGSPKHPLYVKSETLPTPWQNHVL